MKKISYMIILILSAVNAWSQNYLDNASNELLPVPKVRNVDLHFTTGLSFFTSKTFGSGSNYYVAPTLSYKVSERLHVNAGLMVYRNNFFNPQPLYVPAETSVVLRPANNTGVSLYASADYMLSPRLMISGSYYKNVPGLGNTGMYSPYNPSFDAMSLRVDYKISNSVSVGAGMHVIQSNGFNYSPYQNGTMFHQAPF